MAAELCVSFSHSLFKLLSIFPHQINLTLSLNIIIHDCNNERKAILSFYICLLDINTLNISTLSVQEIISACHSKAEILEVNSYFKCAKAICFLRHQ